MQHVCVLSDIKSAVILFLYATVQGQISWCEILHNDRYWSQTGLLLGGTPNGPQKSQILIVNISQMVSHSITCQMGRNMS